MCFGLLPECYGNAVKASDIALVPLWPVLNTARASLWPAGCARFLPGSSATGQLSHCEACTVRLTSQGTGKACRGGSWPHSDEPYSDLLNRVAILEPGAAHGSWGISSLFCPVPPCKVITAPLPRLHASRDHRLPAFRYLNVLNHYRLFPTGSNLAASKAPPGTPASCEPPR